MKKQTDIVSEYNVKLQYEVAKTEVGLRKNQITNEQKMWLQYGMEDMKMRFKTCMALMGTSIYRDYSGNLIFALSDLNGNRIVSKQLLNVKGYEAEILVSGMSERKSALQISWEGSDDSHIYFADIARGISPTAFLKKLKSHGILFQVSGRAEKQAADALLVYSVQTDKISEVAACSGWCKWSDGTWHFAWDDEITMRRILEYEK